MKYCGDNMIQTKLRINNNPTLQERCIYYKTIFPKWPAPIVDSIDGRLYGHWILGNNYRNKNQYYGEYPPNFIIRVFALFPEVLGQEILHLFSGSLGDETKGLKFDINNANPVDYCGDAHNLSQVVSKKFKLILADPPYSEEDAKHYGNPLINRNKVIKECILLLKPKGFLCWLDQVLPMYRKRELEFIGAINVIRSTNHRVRNLFIWQKVDEKKNV